MPQKINMFISNGNFQPKLPTYHQQNPLKSFPLPKAPSALNAPIIARIHNVKPGCGSCGRH